MDDKRNVSVNLGLDFSVFLTGVFVVLKLCNVIAWSWWWVFAPLWITLAVTLAITLICCFVAMLILLVRKL